MSIEKVNKTDKQNDLLIDYDKLPVNELERTMAIDRAYRTIGVTGDLYGFNDLIQDKEWDYSYPTLVKNPDTHYDYRTRNQVQTGVTVFPKTEIEAVSRFHQKYPFMNKVDFSNLLIAGGCLQNLLRGHKVDLEVNCVIDIDIFFYGLTEEEALAKIHQVVAQIGEEYVECYSRNDHAITVVLDHLHMLNSGLIKTEKRYHYRETNPPFQLQFVFRLYNSISEILHGFDLASSAVGYDGNRFYFTSASKFAYEYRCNFLDPSRRSTSYEHRIVKYWLRGFNMIFPNLKLKLDEVKSLATQEHTYIYLPWCNLRLDKQKKLVRDNMIFIICPSCQTEEKYTESEFKKLTKIPKFCVYCGTKLKQLEPKINDDFDYRLQGTFVDHKQTPVHYQNSFFLNEEYWPDVDNDYVSVEDLDCPKLQNYDWYDKIQWSTLHNIMNDQWSHVFIIGQNLDKVLHGQLNLDGIVTDFIDNTIHKNKMFKNNALMKPILEGLKEKIQTKIDQFNQTHEGLPKFITENPGTQLTSSINPIMEAEWCWYGPDHYKPGINLHQFCRLMVDATNGYQPATEILIKMYSTEAEKPNETSQYEHNIKALKKQIDKDRQTGAPPRGFGVY